MKQEVFTLANIFLSIQNCESVGLFSKLLKEFLLANLG